MKTGTLFVIIIVILNSGDLGFSQGTFQNLDFEAARLTGYQPGDLVPPSSAFPDWQSFYGTTPTSTVAFDGVSTGGAVISIMNNDPAFGTVALDGSYSAKLFSTTEPSIVSTTLSQTGLVPAGTESIQIDAVEEGGTFTVVLNNQTIDMILWQTLPNYNVYAGDVSQFAGQSADLSITENAAGSPDFLEMDNIVFSPTTVTPEPSPFVLTAIGGILFALYRRFVKR